MTQLLSGTVKRAWRPGSPQTIQGEIHPWCAEVKVLGRLELVMSIEEPLPGSRVLVDLADAVCRRAS